MYSEQLILSLGWRGHLDVLQIHAFHLAAMANATFAPGVVHQNPPHGFGGSGKEVGPIIPIRLPLATCELQPGFMDERSSLQRLAGLFPGKTMGCETP